MTNATPVQAGPDLAPPPDAKYLMFRLGGTECGLDILRVREIVAMLTVTALPRSPSYVRGVVNLRGQVIPVVDLRLRFGMEAVADVRDTCIVVCRTTTGEVGCVVDEVLEVLRVAEKDIEGPPELPGGEGVPFVSAMAKSAGRVQVIVDVDAALALAGSQSGVRDTGGPL